MPDSPSRSPLLAPPFADLEALAAASHDAYRSAPPYPHISYSGFFNEAFLNEVLEEFPDLSKRKEAVRFNNHNEVKLAGQGDKTFGPRTKTLVDFLNSQPFLDFLQKLTGIKEPLQADPYYEGGGHHEIKPGGLLKIHADFNKNRRSGLDRRINVLVYLNKDWDESWGGHFELWDKDMTACVQKIAPHFNTIAIFSTTDFSYHGHPDPLNCPPDRSRKSIALYYYSDGRPAEEINTGKDHSTLFRARQEGDVKQVVTLKSVLRSVLPPALLRFIRRTTGR